MVGGGRVVGIGLMIRQRVDLFGVCRLGRDGLDDGRDFTRGDGAGDCAGADRADPDLWRRRLSVPLRGAEKEQFAVVQQERKILNMVLTQGQVTMGELVAELQQPRDQVEDMIRSLVGKQLFSGAINWEKGMLYSVESQSLTDGRKCPNCGGELQFAGKGLIVCPYCGSEVFLTKRAAAATTDAQPSSDCDGGFVSGYEQIAVGNALR